MELVCKGMFSVHELWHCQPQRDHHETFELALAAIYRLAALPWNEKPNRAPCLSWRTCGARYEIYEYGDTTKSWAILKKTPIVEIDAKGVAWEPGFAPDCS